MAELLQIRAPRPPARFFSLFEMGFRPFFLGAGAYATLSLGLWLLVHGGRLNIATGWPPPWLHAHEMVFGFGAAAVAGFLLTAVPNWTSTRPLSGGLLAAVFTTWLAGRAGFYLFDPPILSAALDGLFLPVLLLYLTPVLWAGKRKHLAFVGLLLCMVAGNAMCHLHALGWVDGLLGVGLRLGVYALVMMIVVLAGRVVPGFTHNALRRAGVDVQARTDPRIDLAAQVAALLAMLADLLPLDRVVAGALAVVAAVLLLARMGEWQTRRTLGEPILWVLHAGHFWLVAAFACQGLSALTGWLPATSALHAFTAGAIGTMVLAIMTRASLGHTGRPLVVSRAVAVAYGLVIVGGLLRVFGPTLMPQAYRLWIVAGGVAWTAGYAIFTWQYAAILWLPRVEARPVSLAADSAA